MEKINFKKAAASFLSLTITAASSISLAPTSIGTTAENAENPVISRNCPAYSTTSSASSANDDFYYSSWNGTAPSYLAYDLSAVPDEKLKEVIAVWYNNTGVYDYTVGSSNYSNSMPTSYTIELNAAEGGAYPEDNWVVVETVENNPCHSRQHLIDMSGYNWIRINVTGSDNKTDGNVSINFDIHASDDVRSDSWMFYGDSITACGMMNCYGTGVAALVNQIDSSCFPIQENGGIGGIRSIEGAANIDRWLTYFPGKYVSIAYGTNDSWGNQTGAELYYENTAYMVEQVINANKIPIVPKIPYSLETGVNSYLADYNAMIDRIYEEYPEVIKGPDFEKFFYDNPTYLSGDGVHPNDEGYAAMRSLWAETMYDIVYNGKTDADYIIGDVNGDKVVNSEDAVDLNAFILGEKSIDYQYFNTTADINKDDSIDAFDLTALRRILNQ